MPSFRRSFISSDSRESRRAALLQINTQAEMPSHSRSAATSPIDVLANGMRRLEARRNVVELQFFNTTTPPMNPPVDFRSLDYVKQTDENLVCAICRCPFVDPVVLNECDHCFCRDCIRQTWSSLNGQNPIGLRGDCPSCRTPAKLGPRSSTSKILVNILDDLEVYCPHTQDGCRSKVKRGEIQDHVKLYCGYGTVECLSNTCKLPVLRKDSSQDCLHYGVSCFDCHASMLKADLETHWRVQCPDRKIRCDYCSSNVSHSDFEQHSKQDCPAMFIPCPGHEFGCSSRLWKQDVDAHVKNCALAKLAPYMQAQKQRLDEHERAQLQMSRKLEVLEQGLASIKKLLLIQDDDPDGTSADESRIPYLPETAHRDSTLAALEGDLISDPASPIQLDLSGMPLYQGRASMSNVDQTLRTDAGESFPDFMQPLLPSPTAHGPYTSPIHHLLSMHENLREEVARISGAMREIDSRHSMQTLNENLRTREELAYLVGQVGGISRQVQWLTSAHLQRQQGRAAAAAEYSDVASAGAGVEAAVHAVTNAASAVRGVARMVSGSDNAGSAEAGPSRVMARRGTSEEGRTKL